MAFLENLKVIWRGDITMNIEPQEASGAPTSGTLELLTKARELGTVTAFVGGDAAAIAGAR